VIFVTTKRGKSGRPKVNYDGNVSWSNATRLPTLLDAFQYTSVKNEALVNANQFTATNQFALTPGPDGNSINTNWYDYSYRTGIAQNHSVNVSGGNDNTSYYFSFGYSKQQGIVQRNDFERKTVMANVDSRINKVVTVGGKVSYANQRNLSALSSGSLAGEAFNTGGLARLAQVNAPNVSPYNNDGSYNQLNGLLGPMNNKVAQVGFYNQVISLDQNSSNSETNQIQGNVFLQIKPLSWMTLRSSYGLDYQYIDNDLFASGLSGEGFSSVGSASSNFNKTNRWVWTNTAQFDYTFASKHTVGALVGVEQQRTTGSGFGVNRTQLSDPFFTNIQGGFGQVALTGTGGNIGENYLASSFGRLSYSYDKKYTIAGNVRRDGASQLGSNNKYGTFWGVSAGWEIARENFWSAAKLDNVFSSFKIRGSYGRLGNIAGLSNFGTLSTYGAGLYATGSTLSFSNAGNSDLQWESSAKTDIGINFGVLKDKITAEIAYYNNNIDHLILGVTQPPSAGLPNSISTNVGKMYNKGLEFSVSLAPIGNRDFTWASSFNIAFNKNEVTELAPTLPSLISTTSSLESVNITLPGYPIGTLYVTRTAGIDPATGRRIFINAAGKQVLFQHVAPAGQARFMYTDGTTAPSISAADASPYLNTNPKYFGGWENTFRYKNFELNVLLTYQGGYYVYYGGRAGLHDQRFWNNEADILNHWTKAGDNAAFPKVIFGDNISNGSSFPLDINVFKGDFIKVRSMTLGYNLPKSLLDKAKLSNARLYLTGNNLGIITKYPGPDPESSSNGNGTTNQGVDRNQAPSARTFTVGLNIGF
jgi:TonB-linked SusC/RagA family outer membrane protein